MSGITSGVGIFSGVDSASLIEQLLAVDARPKTALQRRSTNISLQQTVYRDFNSKLGNMRSILRGIRDNKAFRAAKATSSNESAIKATASNNAAAGSYQFNVDRLVSTQQMLSRGFGDRDTAGLGATKFTFESTQGRLDRDVALSQLNGGAGVSRGKIVITDSANHVATVDLSRSGTIAEVVEAINANGTALVTAKVVDDKLVLTDRASGVGTMSVANAAGFTTASSLGIAGNASAGKITGTSLIALGASTLLSTLNDSNGVSIAQTSTPSDYSIRIAVGATTVNVNLGDVWESTPGSVNTKTKTAVSTIGGAIERINEALTAAGGTTAAASIDPDGKRLRLTDSANAVISVTNSGTTTTAEMLGLAGPGVNGANGLLSGRRILSGMGTTLANSLNGGSGIGGNGVVDITARDGTFFSVAIDQNASLAQIAESIEAASGIISGGPKVSVRVNDKGTGLAVIDNTGGSSNLIIRGTDGDNTVTALGIETALLGVASSSVQGSNLQRQYVSSATLLSSLNTGKGVGTGTLRMTDATGTTANVVIGASIRTVEDMVKQLNSSGLAISAAINSQGDGIVLTSTSASTGKIKVEDASGQVAKSLNLVGEAKGSGVLNTIDGSFERVLEFSAADTLTAVMNKINNANSGAIATIVNDGSTAAPFRLNLTASSTGAAGRFQIDTNGFDLGLSTLQTGQDSRVFFGASDPALGLLLSSSTNTVDNAIQGVKLDLLSTTTSPATISVSRDSTVVEARIDEFIAAYNAMSESIAAQSSYDKETKRGGPLLGDGTTIALRQTMTATIQSRPIGSATRFSRVGEIGIKVAKDGKLEFDKTKFRAALAQDPESVEKMLFARTQTNTSSRRDLGGGASVVDPDQAPEFSELGIFAQFEEMATRYIDSTRGILIGKDKSLTSLNENIAGQIKSLDSRIASKRQVLQQQFLRMEKTIGRLQGQQGALSSLGG